MTTDIWEIRSQYYELHASHVTEQMRRSFRDAVLTMPVRREYITPFYSSRMLDALGRVATVWRGKCLSTRFESFKELAKFVCTRGHHFALSALHVQKGRWCPTCAHERYLDMLQSSMHELAAAHGGLCLSDGDIGLSKYLQWKCARGHEWVARPRNAQHYWCGECKVVDRTPKIRSKTIEQMRRVAASHGGLCLSTEYLGMHGHLDWQCQAGHRWRATPTNVWRERWCPACSIRAGWQRDHQMGLLDAENGSDSGCDSDIGESKPYREHTPMPAPQLGIRPEVAGWLEGFRERRRSAHVWSGNAARTNAAYALAYVLAWDEAGNPEVQLYKASRSSEGTVSKLVQRWHNQAGMLVDLPNFVVDEDLAILRSLGRPDRDRGSFALRPGSCADLVQTIVNTGRAFTAEARQAEPRVLRTGPARCGDIEWQPQLDARLRPVLRTDPLASIVIWTEPPSYVDTHSGEVGTVEIPWRTRDIADYLLMPAVSPAEASLVGVMVREFAPGLPVPPEQETSAIRVIDIQPIPVLSFDTAPVYASGWGPEGLQIRALDFVTVSFNYDGVVLNAYDDVTLVRNARGEVVHIKRDVEFEKSRLYDLIKMRLHKIPANTTTGPHALPSHMRTLKDPAGWPDYVLRSLPILRQGGWRVIMSSRFSFSVINADSISGTLQQTSDGWFEVELALVVGARNIGLTPLLPTFFRRDRRWLSGAIDTIDDDETIEFKTSSGEQLRLRAGRLKPAMRVLADRFDARSEGIARIAQDDISRLEALVKSSDWQFRGDAWVSELAEVLKRRTMLRLPPDRMQNSSRQKSNSLARRLSSARDHHCVGHEQSGFRRMALFFRLTGAAIDGPD